MDFRVYVVIEAPLLSKKYELLIPIDRRIHDILKILSNEIPELSQGYYKDKKPSLYNKSDGSIYEMNILIKNSNIKTGTRLILI